MIRRTVPLEILQPFQEAMLQKMVEDFISSLPAGLRMPIKLPVKCKGKIAHVSIEYEHVLLSGDLQAAPVEAPSNNEDGESLIIID